MKITSNELRKIVKKIIKEEEEKTPTEKINELNAELNNQFKIFRGHFRGGERSLVPNVQKLETYYSNFDKKAYPKDYNLLDSSLKGLIQLLEKYNEITNKPSITGLKMLLPQFIKIVIDTNEYLAEIFEISENTELKGYTRPIQFNIGGMRQAANSMIILLSRVEALSPQQQNNPPQQQNNIPQQQNNVPQQQNNVPQQQNNTSQLTGSLQQLKDNIKTFNKSFENLKYKYIDDTLTEKMLANSVNQILTPIETLISSISNSNSTLSEKYLPRNKKSKINIFENSLKITVFDNYFDELIMDLNRNINKLDERMPIEEIRQKLATVKNIIGIIRDNLQKMVNNPL